MTLDSSKTNSAELKDHRRLVTLILMESELLEKDLSSNESQRHIQILDFLLELQIINSRRLTNEKSQREESNQENAFPDNKSSS